MKNLTGLGFEDLVEMERCFGFLSDYQMLTKVNYDDYNNIIQTLCDMRKKHVEYEESKGESKA